MVFQLYYDFGSQPCRALYNLFKKFNFDFEEHPISFFNGDHKKADFKARFPNGTIPAFAHDDFSLEESTSVARYVTELQGDKVGSNWYPKELKDRIRVDAEIDAYHSFVRPKCLGFCLPWYIKTWPVPVEDLGKLVIVATAPTGNSGFSNTNLDKPSGPPEQIVGAFEFMLNSYEKKLGERKFVASDTISIADIFVACEMQEAWFFDQEILFKERPNVKAWWDRVRAEFTDFDKVGAPVLEFVEQAKAKLTSTA